MFGYLKQTGVVGIICICFSICSAYSGGTGEPNDPYQIVNASDLLTLSGTAADCNKCFMLTADIDLEGQFFTTAIIAQDTSPSGAGFQGTPFSGVFDGNGHKISNFIINSSDNTHLGLFGCLINGSVKNLGLENFNVYGISVTAGFAGETDGSIIQNCFANGSVSGGSVAGFVGKNYGSTIENCSFTGSISGSNMRVGGLVGYNNGGTIKKCFSDVNITADNSSYCVGGLAGENRGGTIEDSFSMGSVVSSSHSPVGGLVGYNNNSEFGDAIIRNSFSTVCVSGFSSVGGLMGYNFYSSNMYHYKPIIENCYATGSVSGSSYVGGLVGNCIGYGVSNCYSTGPVSGSGKYIGGLMGQGGDIHNCYSTSSVSGDSNSSYIGGLTGSGANITNCYSTGCVSGSSGAVYIGGLAGTGDFISNCYSAGVVNGDNAGGLVGAGWQGISLTACFWDVNSSGITDGVGYIEPDPNGITGKTTEEMQTLSTYTNVGWDFSYDDGDEADWFIQIDEYPILTWQISPADIYTDGKNNFIDFAVFAEYWMRKDCRIYNDYCNWADLNFDGSVDIDDLFELMNYWLEEGIYE